MSAEDNLRAGRLDEALADSREAVRKAPADVRLRRFFFQLLCVVGQWDKALTQLNVLADMDADSLLLARIFEPTVRCEAFRAEVFVGKRSPLIFGEPEEWVGLLVQANALVAEGEFAASRELRERALEAAPAVPGEINGHAFEWLGDADSRLGPVLEVILEGKYYWVPFSRIQAVRIEPPTDLRNLVWTPANFVWTNGGEAPGFIPSRYPGSESSADVELKLARKTAWDEKDPGLFFGTGQRLLATNETEYSLLEVRKIAFTPVSASAAT